jgi:hypothetical protein
LLLEILRTDLLEGFELELSVVVKIGDEIIELLLNGTLEIKHSGIGVVKQREIVVLAD